MGPEQGSVTASALLADTRTTKKCTAERSKEGRGRGVKCAGLVMLDGRVSFLPSEA